MDNNKPLMAQIDLNRLPRHIGIIMDGNGRWAKKRFLPRIVGHREGVKVVDRIVTLCRHLNIPALTLYAFSNENWHRPAQEITALMDILVIYLQKEVGRMLKEDIRFNTIGNIDELPDFVKKIVDKTSKETSHNNGMTLTLALSYGSRDEIIRACKQIAVNVHAGDIDIDDINYELFERFLDTKDLPDLDLLIRTSGELRISNFLLWQLAYAELYFSKRLWPDFREEDLLYSIIEFQKRERRFGMTHEQLKMVKGCT